MNHHPNDIKIWKQKAKAALQALSSEQLMDILAINRDDDYSRYQLEIRELNLYR